MIKKLLVALAVAFSVALQGWAQEITILHTNDIHCGISEGVTLSSVSWLKNVYKNAGLPVVLVDAGDALQGSPLGTLTKGSAIIRLMNACEYDFAIPGNHEFDYGMENFLDSHANLKCNYFSANLFRDGKLLLQPYKIMDLGGRKIGFVGVTTPGTLASANPVVFKDPQNRKKQLYSFGEKIKKKVPELYKIVQKSIDKAKKEGAEKIVLVAHFGNGYGLWNIADLVKNLHNVDVVIDGHTHQDYILKLPNGDGKEILVSQTGSRLSSVGRIRITDQEILADHIYHLSGNDEIVDEGVVFENGNLDEILMAVLGHTGYNLCALHPETKERLVRKTESNLGDFVADAFRKVCDADIAVVNGGALRADISEGIVTFRDVLSVMPFADELCVIEVTGKQVLDMLEFSAYKYPDEFGGFLHVSGMEFTIDSHIPSPVVTDSKGAFVKMAGPRRVKNVRIGGVPLNEKKTYTLCGTDFILRNAGDGYAMLGDAPLAKLVVLKDSDAMVEYIHNYLEGVIPDTYNNFSGLGRIKISE